MNSVVGHYLKKTQVLARRRMSLESKMEALVARSADVRRFLAYQALDRADSELLRSSIEALGHAVLGEVRRPKSEPESAHVTVLAEAERQALLAIAEAAQEYHEDCAHDDEGAAAQCDSICDAWKAWRNVERAERR